MSSVYKTKYTFLAFIQSPSIHYYPYLSLKPLTDHKHSLYLDQKYKKRRKKRQENIYVHSWFKHYTALSILKEKNILLVNRLLQSKKEKSRGKRKWSYHSVTINRPHFLWSSLEWVTPESGPWDIHLLNTPMIHCQSTKVVHVLQISVPDYCRITFYQNYLSSFHDKTRTCVLSSSCHVPLHSLN